MRHPVPLKLPIRKVLPKSSPDVLKRMIPEALEMKYGGILYDEEAPCPNCGCESFSAMNSSFEYSKVMGGKAGGRSPPSEGGGVGSWRIQRRGSDDNYRLSITANIQRHI